MEDLIKTILTEWNEKELPRTIERNFNSDLKKHSQGKPKKIIVVTGFRRTGKTYSMLHLIKQLLNKYSKEEIFYINFEDERIPQKTEFLTKLIPVINQYSKKKIVFLFLDEVQNIPNWSKWLRRIYDNEDFRIFVSGSSSKMSSHEIPTELRGRFLEFKIYPLSFNEFLKFKNTKIDFQSLKYSNKQKSNLLGFLNEFLEFGSLPEITLVEAGKKEEIAKSYYQTVVRRDIIERHHLRNEESLKALLRLLLNSTSYSISRLYNSLKSMHYEVGKSTLQSYLNYIENSYFIFSVPIFSYKIKDQMQYPRKHYFIDTIFVNKLSTKFSKNMGRMYENCVAVELKRKNKEFYYWKDKKNHEVDFVIKQGTEIGQLVQVCYDINDLEIKKREIRALINASKELKCNDLLIITKDLNKEESVNWFGTKRKIKYVPLWKWLLNR